MTGQHPVELLVEAGAHSEVNMTYIHAVATIVKCILQFGISADDILLITFYAAQKRCYKRWFKSSEGLIISVEQIIMD